MPGDLLDLRKGTVLILQALNGEHRALNLRHLGFDVPLAEFRSEPGVPPAPKSGIGVGMVSCQSLWQIAS